MKLLFRLTLFVALTLVLWTSCQDDPNSAGDLLIPPGDLISIDSVDSFTGSFEQKTSYYREQIDLGGATRILLGKN